MLGARNCIHISEYLVYYYTHWRILGVLLYILEDTWYITIYILKTTWYIIINIRRHLVYYLVGGAKGSGIRGGR